MAEQLFDINAILAGSAEVYISRKDSVPPALGYPITTSQDSTLEEIGSGTGNPLSTFTVTRDGVVDLMLDTNSSVGEADGKSRIIGSSAAGAFLKSLRFEISGQSPSLSAVIETSGSFATKTMLEDIATGGSLYIQYFGRVAEFQFSVYNAASMPLGANSVSGSGAADGDELVYTWNIGNASDTDRLRAYTLFQIPPGGTFSVTGAQFGGNSEIVGYNSLWSVYGDGLISRDATGFQQNQEVQRLRLAAVLPAVKLFREDTTAVLTFTCFSLSPAFIARLTGNSVIHHPAAGSGANQISAAYDEVSVTQGSNIEEFAVCMRMDDAPNESGKQSQLFFPSVGVTGNLNFAFARTPQGTAVELESLFSALWASNAIYQTQTDEWALVI